MIEQQPVLREEDQHRGRPAQRTREAPADQEDVDESEAAEDTVPESEPELVERQQAQPNRERDDPELERGLLEKDGGIARAAERREPVPPLHDRVNGVRIDRLVVADIGPAETDEERDAERDEHESQPAAIPSVAHGTNDHLRGVFTCQHGYFSISYKLHSAPFHVPVAFKATS